MAYNSKVTIGFCVKNAEKTVKEALRSIIEQEYPIELIELIIVDGCSKDKTLSLIQKELLKADIKSKIFIENKGLGHARQIVVDNATGDYIIWVDGDMILPRNFVKKQVEFMERNPKVGIGKARYGLLNQDSLPAFLEDVEFVVNFMNEERMHSKVLGTSGCIYRIEALRQAGGFNEAIKGAGEDSDVEHRIKAKGWLLSITRAIFYERRRETWRDLWNEYFWHGMGGGVLFKTYKKVINIYNMLPPIALLSEFLRVPKAYRLTYQKKVIFLPLHYAFKRLAWFLGFLKGKFKS